MFPRRLRNRYWGSRHCCFRLYQRPGYLHLHCPVPLRPLSLQTRRYQTHRKWHFHHRHRHLHELAFVLRRQGRNLLQLCLLKYYQMFLQPLQFPPQLDRSVSFVEILFAVRTITFRSTLLFKGQNEHPLTHIFSLQQRAVFSHQENRTNGHFHGDREKLFVRESYSHFRPLNQWRAKRSIATLYRKKAT